MRRPSAIRPFIGVLAVLALVAACSSDSDDADGAAGEGTTTTAPTGDWVDLPGAEGVEPDPDGTDPLEPLPDEVALPIVFVHGFAGSAQQFESQAMRFVANGYPADRIVAYDHDGAGADIAGYAEGVAEVVDETLEAFDADQVYLVGHSRGTAVSNEYLSDPEHADKVAKYVAIDGRPCSDAVPCLEVTQEDIPGQAHVEVATSAESFEMQYEFLVGEEPEVVEIVPQREPVVLEGRAVEFPANIGREVTLDVWAVDPETGHRTEDEPHVSFELDSEGAFGPMVVESGAHYEYVLSAEDTDVDHHLYLQPYVRSSNLVRLLSSEPDGAIRTNTNTGDDHTALIAIRMREWYAADEPEIGDEQLDVLEITTRTGDGESETVDAIVAFVGNDTIGLHIHDAADTPGESTLEALPYFSEQPFQSGIDVFMAADDSADGTITVTNFPRGDTDNPQTLNVANWPSSRHAVSVVFSDYAVD